MRNYKPLPDGKWGWKKNIHDVTFHIAMEIAWPGYLYSPMISPNVCSDSVSSRVATEAAAAPLLYPVLDKSNLI
jgi:hypothetical protein